MNKKQQRLEWAKAKIERGIYVLVNAETGQLWELNYNRDYLNTDVRKRDDLDDAWVVVEVVPVPAKSSRSKRAS